jgi:hypothetical protein
MRTHIFSGICFLTGAASTSAENNTIEKLCGAGKSVTKLKEVEAFAEKRSLPDLEKSYLCHIVHRFAGSTDSEDGANIKALLGDLEYRMEARRKYEEHARFTSKFCPSPSRIIDPETLEHFEKIASTQSKMKKTKKVKRDLNRVEKGQLCGELRRLDLNPNTKDHVLAELSSLEDRVKSWIPTKAGFFGWAGKILGHEEDDD